MSTIWDAVGKSWALPRLGQQFCTSRRLFLSVSPVTEIAIQLHHRSPQTLFHNEALSRRLTIQKETDDGFYLGFSLFAPSMIMRIPEICLWSGILDFGIELKEPGIQYLESEIHSVSKSLLPGVTLSFRREDRSLLRSRSLCHHATLLPGNEDGVLVRLLTCNRPLLSSKNPHFQNEARCTTFLVKMSFICMRMKNDFHIKGWALTLVLKQSSGGTRKWPIHKRLTGFYAGSLLMRN